jgi:hypothetical protein
MTRLASIRSRAVASRSVGTMSDHHDHEHDDVRALSGRSLRATTLESLLVDNGLLNPQTLDVLIDTFETKVRPRNGGVALSRPAQKARRRNAARQDGPVGLTHGHGFGGALGAHPAMRPTAASSLAISDVSSFSRAPARQAACRHA